VESEVSVNHPERFRIDGSGIFLPPGRVSAAEIDARTGQPEGWTLKATGVAERRFATYESSAEMGAKAALKALLNANLSLPDIDLLICASGTPQQIIPCTAALIARELNWEGVACFDTNLTCLSFLIGLDMASAWIATGRAKRIMIISTEIASRGLNWAEPEAAALMGDGAAAVIVSAGSSSSASRLVASRFETWPEGAGYTEIRGGGSSLPAALHVSEMNTSDYLFHMDGPAVFRLTAKRLGTFLTDLLSRDALHWDDIDWVIPHQASLPGLEHMAKRLRIPEGKLIRIVATHGNTIAASIPMALHSAITTGKLKRGHSALLLGTGAGFSLGGVRLIY
jgi:3-oxoacyl-[acyl-carrier-protein] synthase III